MAFALSIVKLEEAMKKPGCPICRIQHDDALKAVDTLLWELTNEPDIRVPINDAYGFCPPHAQLLVAREMMTSGPTLGVNIIYSLLNKKVIGELKKVNAAAIPGKRMRQSAKALADRVAPESRLLNKLATNGTSGTLLTPKGPCPLCKTADESAKNNLEAVFEEIEQGRQKFMEIYQASNGLCLEHLRSGLETYMEKMPAAADFLIQDTIRRLAEQQEQMQEYLRKHNWEYRDEIMSDEEQNAFLRSLTFFTGLPGARFTHKVKEF